MVRIPQPFHASAVRAAARATRSDVPRATPPRWRAAAGAAQRGGHRPAGPGFTREERARRERGLLEQHGALLDRRERQPCHLVFGAPELVPEPEPKHGVATGQVREARRLLREDPERPVPRARDEHPDPQARVNVLIHLFNGSRLFGIIRRPP